MVIEGPRIGLLPLYLALYDTALPGLLTELEPFLKGVGAAFQGQGVTVVEAPVCRVKDDVASAVMEFSRQDVDLIVTLHLAYSPSLEAIGPLVESRLPILMLDTTPDLSFGLDTDPMRLLYNHGIHGLQDLASVLRRRGKDYWIVAGHLSNPSVMKRACAIARGARAATRLRTSRVLRIGPSFSGMGDFRVADLELFGTLRVDVDEILPASLLDDVRSISDEAVAAEMEDDRTRFAVEAPADVHARTVRLGLGLRQYLERNGYHAFSMNFLAFQESEGPIATVPFLECCKAMARGVGYAGEGDVLTAAFVGALSTAIGETTFTEMFCPDWQGGSVFLSHMGEFNPAVAASKPRLYEKEFPFTPAQNPATLACAPRSGAATLVNLAPGPDSSYTLIAAPVEVLGDGTHASCRDWIRGWVKPSVPLESFLEEYSRHGGTHHAALSYGCQRNALEAFARAAGLGFVMIGDCE
jgi:L-arabinose isomerase